MGRGRGSGVGSQGSGGDFNAPVVVKALEELKELKRSLGGGQ
jgi:hypothetical protein